MAKHVIKFDILVCGCLEPERSLVLGEIRDELAEKCGEEFPSFVYAQDASVYANDIECDLPGYKVSGCLSSGIGIDQAREIVCKVAKNFQKKHGESAVIVIFGDQTNA